MDHLYSLMKSSESDSSRSGSESDLTRRQVELNRIVSPNDDSTGGRDNYNEGNYDDDNYNDDYDDYGDDDAELIRDRLRAASISGEVGHSSGRFGPRTWAGWLWYGPEKPADPTVTMVLGRAQTYPETVITSLVRDKQHPWRFLGLILVAWLAVWGLVFWQLASHSVLAVPSIETVNTDQFDEEYVHILGCGSSPSVWRGKNQACGIDGEKCVHPIGTEFKFKCFANCVRESWTYSDTPVGAYESIYRPYVIGGNNSYRADSLVCGAAVHHGAISPVKGGCGVIRFTGRHTNYVSETRNGIESIGYDGDFAESFEFVDISNRKCSGCYDYRSYIVAFNLLMSVVYGYFVWHPALFYWPLFVMGFWTVVLASNPPVQLNAPPTVDIYAELISLAFRRLLPCALVGYVIYVSSVRLQLDNMRAHLSRAAIWVGFFWAGILENYVFGAIPIDRLTVHDLNKQAGAWTALITIVGVVVAIVAGQTFVIWRMGKVPLYLPLYIGFGLALVILSWVPGQTLRIHHYILALIFLPGTGVKTTASLAYQGLLVALFIAGVSRWGFDSILQTYEQLRRGAPSLYGGLPQLLAPIVGDGSAIIRWNSTLASESTRKTEVGAGWDSFSIIVNDIERYRGGRSNFTIEVMPDTVMYYVRIAFARANLIGDYTRAGILNVTSGEWHKPLPGPS